MIPEEPSSSPGSGWHPASRGLGIRLLGYGLTLYVSLKVYVALVTRALDEELADWEAADLLRENQPLEWIQTGVLLTGILLGIGLIRRGESTIQRILVLLMIGALTREMDSVWKAFLYDGFHFVPAVLVIGCSMYLIYRGGQTFRTSLEPFFLSPGFFLLLGGFFLVAIASQILGERDIWKAFAPKDSSEAKRFVEEGLELLGYLCILFGFIEERFFRTRFATRSERPSASEAPATPRS